MKHTSFNRVVSALIALVMVVGFLPTGLIPVQAEAHTWNDSATMTLTADGQEVTPASVVETADTKLKVYTVFSDKNYTLQTSADNDYAVVFDIQWAQIGEDEYGNIEYDTELDLELDNVTIRTYNPRQTVFAGGFAAMCFDTSSGWSNNVNLILTGENTVQLLGAQNDTAEETWSAVHFGQCKPIIKGSGTLNAKAVLENAAGQVSAIDFSNYTQIAETVTINAVADAGTAQGNGITINYAGIDIAAGATLNITASKSGIVFVGTTTSYLTLDGQLNIKAADHGIDWQAYAMIMGDGAKLTVTGLTEGAAPKVGVLTTRGVTIGANCIVNVSALNEAFSCTASNATSDYSAPISIGENSVVTVSGAVESNVYALDCGYKTAHNSYWQNASYPASTLTLAAGAKLTVNAGYRAIRVLNLDMAAGSAMYVTATKLWQSNSEYECTPVFISSEDTYIREGATLEIDAVSEYAINGYTKLNLLSNDIYIKSTGVALYSTSIVCGEGVVALESQDGNLWRPFSKKSSMPYMTTRKVENHECYNETVTPVEGQESHLMVCLYCGKETTAPCQWDYGSWSDTNAGIMRFRCKLCKQDKYVNVQYHSHTYETWTPLTGTVNQQHEAFCTFPGCGAGTSDYCSSYYGEEYHVGLTTMRRDCTRCGQYTTRELEGVTTAHVEAKAATCNTPGNVEYWSCGHCNKYFADANCTTELSPLDVFITPGQHNYGPGGACTVCGDTVQTLSFMEADGGLYEYDNYNFVIVGKDAEGKLYVMGNLQEDGKRAGLEIPGAWIDENGILTISSDYAEFMVWDYMNDGFVVDGGYLSLMNGELFVYNTESKGDQNLPFPATFNPCDYSDGTGLGHMSAYLSGQYANREYLVFNAETKTFEVSATEEDSLYIYVQLCDHPNMAYTRETPATCTRQGCRENWYCDKCQTYYSNAAGTVLLDIPEYVNPAEYLTIPAAGHSFGADNKCVNCGMDKPVYAPVTTVEAFDNLGPNAYYLIVFRDGDKTYAAALPPVNRYWDDMDGDGVYDLFAIDENGNEIPDCIENADCDENGTLDILEDWDYDEVVGTQDDYMRIYEELAYAADMAAYEAANFVEVTIAADGTITLADEGAMEFQLQEAGIWGGVPVDEGYGDYEIQPNERICAAWVPNYWVAAGGYLALYGPEQFRMHNRYFGDHEYPGMMDMKNWKISFREDGTLCMLDSWSDYDDTAALQMVFYVNDMGEPAMTVFGAPEMEWEYSPVYSTMTKTLPAYLYAATPAGVHTCTWGEWVADENGQTHTHTCTDETCGKTETEDHRWNEGECTVEPGCTTTGTMVYTCLDCKAVKTETVEATGHKYIDHAAQAPTCTEIGWNAYQTCANCDYTSYEELPANGHAYIDHAAQAPTCTEIGWNAYQTCANCDYTTYQELPAGHRWSEWTAQPDGSYYRICSGCQSEEWMNLPEDKPVNNTPEDNAASSTLEGSDIELIDQVLTDEEQSQVAAGAEVSIYLVVEDISEEVSTEDQEAAEEVMEEGSQVGMYLDINLFKQVEEEETQVTQTNSAVTITIVIPEELLNTAAGITRNYQIIRVHDDGTGNLITDVIEGVFNPADNTFTFQTDKFSTYALVYSDTEKTLIPGDFNDDGSLSNADVIALMWHVLFPDENPVSGDGDLDHDGAVTNEDVIKLMWHILFPEENPL